MWGPARGAHDIAGAWDLKEWVELTARHVQRTAEQFDMQYVERMPPEECPTVSRELLRLPDAMQHAMLERFAAHTQWAINYLRVLFRWLPPQAHPMVVAAFSSSHGSFKAAISPQVPGHPISFADSNLLDAL